MKRLILFISVLSIALISSAQTVIEMEKEQGVYKIPCKVNGVQMKLTFDSGAASVCISESMAEYMYENGFITEDDFIGVGESEVADGRIVDHLVINLRDIQIENMHLYNVRGVVIFGQKGSLLLGQTAIQALGPVTIDGNRLIIHNAVQELTEGEVSYMRTQIEHFISDKNYKAAINCLQKLDKQNACTWYDLQMLAHCYCYTEDYDNCIKVCQRWLNSYDDQILISNEARYHIYDYMGYAQFYRKNADYNEAIKWFKRQYSLASVALTGEEQQDEIRYAYTMLGHAYYQLSYYSTAREWYEKAFNYRLSYLDCRSVKDAQKLKDEKLAKLAYYIYECYKKQVKMNEANKALVISARMGYAKAQVECKVRSLKY